MDEQKIETGGGASARLSRPESALWGSTVVLGAIWCLIGMLCVGAAGIASVAAVFYVGALLIIAGIAGLVHGFRGGHPRGGLIAVGIMSLVAGVLLLLYPGSGLAALTLLLIAYFWIAGLFRVLTAVVDRYENWGWDFASGACSIIVGVIAVRAWPVSAFWLLGVLVGAELIIRGVAMIAGGVTARQALRHLRIQSP